MSGRGWEGAVALAPLSAGFLSLPLLPLIKLGPSSADLWVGGRACAHSRPLWVSPTNSLVRLGVFLLPPQPPRVFSIRGLRLYFQSWSPGLCGLLHSPAVRPGLSMCECGAVGSASCRTACPIPHQPPPCCESSLPWLPVSAPPTSLDECFFFISLVVRLPYSLSFCQFWLVFVFKLLLSFFWLCEEVPCVYLRLHLGQKHSYLFEKVSSILYNSLTKDLER